MAANYAPGRYACEIEGQKADYHNDEKLYVELYFQPLVDLDGQGMPLNAVSQATRLWITDKAVTFSVAKLRSMGWYGDDVGELNENLSGKFHSFAGQRVNLVCRINDKGYNEWEFEIGPRSTKSVPIERMAKDRSRFKHILKVTAVPPTRPPAAAPDPSDIPF